MSKSFVFYLIACYTVCILAVPGDAGSVATKASCRVPQSKSMNWLADFANKYKKINICDYKCNSKAVMDSEGRWIVSYRANTILKTQFEADKLCECMRKFLFQSDWAEGAVHVCKPECESLTIFVIGSRNPAFIGLKSVTDTCEPVKILGSALEHYSDAQLGGKNCRSTTGRTSTGQFRIVSECDNDPEPQKICRIMYDYLNSENWLDRTTTHESFVKDNKLYLDIVEKTVMGYCY